MTPSRTVSRVGILMAAGLLILAALPSAASAADTRILYVGDPTLTGANPWAYQLTPTPVSPGQQTRIDVLVKNFGKQTLTHGLFGMGTLISPDATDLPAGWTIASIAPATGCRFDGGTVDASGNPVGPWDGVSCDLGSLAKGASKSFRIILNAGATLDAPIEAAVTVAENVGGNVGSNGNTFVASTLGFTLAAGDDDHIATWLPKGKVHTTAGANGLSTIIELLGDNGGDGNTVLIDDGGNGSANDCTNLGVVCVGGHASRASVNNGASVSPYFIWTTTWIVPAAYKLGSKSGVIHWFDDTSKAPETIFYSNKTSCSARNAPSPCADFTIAPNPDDSTTQIVTVVMQTKVNGYIKLR